MNGGPRDETPRRCRAFPRSWGAEFLRAGEVRFRTWAPGVSALMLRLDGVDTPMQADEGWFELLATGVEPGAHYQFVLPDGLVVPDPASRGQVEGVHGPSLVVDPTHYAWSDDGWTGRRWEEAIIYEIHVGTFTPQGSFLAAIDRLPYLAELGVTAIEIMPVAQFSGERGWGYDGVLPYAPHAAYGTPDDMKAFIDAAHGNGLMVLLDVVYNHFGPDGNYLHALAPAFFHLEAHTPWGAAIAYERPPVRRFFIENALYWLEEFHLDGLRFDAIDQVRDPESETEMLVELAQLVRLGFPERQIHLTTEDNRNITRLHEREANGAVPRFTAEWNDDWHNAAHVIATGETDGYYEDFADRPRIHLARALAEGFAYQGEPSRHAGGEPRGEASGHLPPTAFIDFLQNHDQVGNRALGERLALLCEEPMRRVLRAMLLLSPHIPLLFMGEEWDAQTPFLFFTDFEGGLADAVREGRRREFAKFGAFNSAEQQREIPDPNAQATFESSRLDWSQPEGAGAESLAFTRKLIALRKRHILPLLGDATGGEGRIVASPDGLVAVDWHFASTCLSLRANLTDADLPSPLGAGEVIFAWPEALAGHPAHASLPGLSILVTLADRQRSGA